METIEIAIAIEIERKMTNKTLKIKEYRRICEQPEHGEKKGVDSIIPILIGLDDDSLISLPPFKKCTQPGSARLSHLI